MSKLEDDHWGTRMPKEAWNPRVRMPIPTDAEHVLDTITQWVRDISIIAACWVVIIYLGEKL